MKKFNPSELVNPTVTNLPPSGIRKLFDVAAEMKDVVSLGIGEPDFVTPFPIREAAVHSLDKGHTHYTSNAGMTELRKEVCKYMRRRFDLPYDLSQTFITVGGSEAIDLTIRALISTGDEVLIPEPCFVCYSPIVKLVGGIPVPITTKAKDEFRLTPELLKNAITSRSKLLILPYPNNPTGAIMTKEDLEKIADVIRDTNICILSDEIYAELTYTGNRHISIAELDGMYDRTIIVSGFSKAYAMTGWRLGFVCAHKDFIEPMIKIHQYAIMCAPTSSQYAAIKALRDCDGEIKKMKDEYNIRRRLIVDGFNKIGFDCFEPLGAFYCFPSVKSTGLSSEAFSNRLLHEEKVAVVPGNAFGISGEGYIRCSYASSIKNISTALERIARFADKIR